MLNIRDLKIDTASLGKPLLLVEVRPYSEYKDGKALEGIAGYRYDVCLVAPVSYTHLTLPTTERV